MSKTSKLRDLWRQLHASDHARHPDWCPGCGYHRLTAGAHRADCTAPAENR